MTNAILDLHDRTRSQNMKIKFETKSFVKFETKSQVKRERNRNKMKAVENHLLLAEDVLVPRVSHPETEMKRMQAVRETRSAQQSGVQRKLCINYRILRMQR